MTDVELHNLLELFWALVSVAQPCLPVFIVCEVADCCNTQDAGPEAGKLVSTGTMHTRKKPILHIPPPHPSTHCPDPNHRQTTRPVSLKPQTQVNTHTSTPRLRRHSLSQWRSTLHPAWSLLDQTCLLVCSLLALLLAPLPAVAVPCCSCWRQNVSVANPCTTRQRSQPVSVQGSWHLLGPGDQVMMPVRSHAQSCARRLCGGRRTPAALLLQLLLLLLQRSASPPRVLRRTCCYAIMVRNNHSAFRSTSATLKRLFLLSGLQPSRRT